MRDWVTAYIGLGSNLGESAATLVSAIAAIDDMEGVALMSQSSLYASAPVDADGPDYVNAVVEVQTRLTAPALLGALQAIELRAGRERPYRNAPRTLDLDLLLYGDASMDSDALTLPHPRMWERAFVVLPLAEIAPQRVPLGYLHSVSHQRVQGYGKHVNKGVRSAQ
ncbi:MAG: 2-amino-4-hydroxy-6-hydroxymethyldihydropteridine diphosphokinase [Rhodoferax sp.]|nr:2-amino-4-hydroxy-6-hydroxymethyldihydropteridine diphosphokinase [Rhodoferax sp.]